MLAWWRRLTAVAGVGFSPAGGLHPLLRHPTRLRAYALVHERPGLTQDRLARHLEIPAGTLAYHLAALEGAGLLHSVRAGRVRLYYALGAVPHDAEDAALLEHRTTRAILLYLVDHPGAGIDGIRADLDLSERAAYADLKRLHDAGLVRNRGYLKYDRLSPTAKAYALLRPR